MYPIFIFYFMVLERVQHTRLSPLVIRHWFYVYYIEICDLFYWINQNKIIQNINRNNYKFVWYVLYPTSIFSISQYYGMVGMFAISVFKYFVLHKYYVYIYNNRKLSIKYKKKQIYFTKLVGHYRWKTL